uniref:Uncharacterized protein n=1 Tax=Arundo donax TaxID=35708 RepID=A0A0A9BJD7_ARUDO
MVALLDPSRLSSPQLFTLPEPCEL